MDGGATGDEATRSARARIGSDDELSAVMLARSGVRSVTARFPWAVFGFGPVLMLALVVYTALLIQVGLFSWSPAIPPWSILWARFSFDVLNWLATYAAPLAIAAVLCVVGIRQRITVSWIVLGLAIVCIVGGFNEIGVRWSDVATQPNKLYLGFESPFSRQIVVGLYRAAINVALVGLTFWVWFRREIHTA